MKILARLGLCLSLICLASCAGLPALLELEQSERTQLLPACSAVFPCGPFRVVHTIEISLPMGKTTSLIGVSVGDSAKHTVRSLLISPEGVILFDAEQAGGGIQVFRALPPLDEPEFAQRLFGDVGHIFFAPKDQHRQLGRLADQRRVCRFGQSGRLTDVILGTGGDWTIRSYDARGRVTRELVAHPPVQRGFARHMELSVPGVAGYQMRFELLRVEDPKEE